MCATTADAITMDGKLFAHINTDPFLQGSYQLEGNYLNITAAYLDQYLRDTPTDATTRPLTQLQAMLNDLALYDERIKQFQKNPSQSELEHFTSEIYDKIIYSSWLSLKPHQTLYNNYMQEFLV